MEKPAPPLPHLHPKADEASAWVRRFALLAPLGGMVLDVACGGGRHTRLFLDLGFGYL